MFYLYQGLYDFIQSRPGIREFHSTILWFIVGIHSTFFRERHIVRNRKMLNQTSREMWQAVSRSFERLDGKVPYIISAGNHEYGYRAAENGKTHFPEYFPFERNRAWYDCVVSDFPN